MHCDSHSRDAANARPEAIKAKDYGPYADPALGSELPSDFLSDLDITNGNSGSPTPNSRGELVGLAFDGTIVGHRLRRRVQPGEHAHDLARCPLHDLDDRPARRRRPPDHDHLIRRWASSLAIARRARPRLRRSAARAPGLLGDQPLAR